MDKWISVEERLPETSEGLSLSKAVLVWCHERKNMFTASWFMAGACWSYFGNSGKLAEIVTHWRHLPEPPEKEEIDG